MFQTAAGVRIPFPEKLSEQYEQDGDTLLCNLSFETLADFVRAFYAELDGPLFLAIHPDAEKGCAAIYARLCGNSQKRKGYERSHHHLPE